MSLGKDQASFLLDQCSLIEYATLLGFRVTPGEMQRTDYQQKEYVRTGRSKTMYSMHLLKLAHDPNFFKEVDGREVYVASLPKEEAYELLKPLGVYWEKLNPKNRWGGNFDKDFDRVDPWVDLPHFERQR